MKSRIILRIVALTLAVMTNCIGVSESLVMPARLEVIEDEAFMGDTSISRVTLSDTVTRIGSRAFADSSLTEIHLPRSITYIADDAFEGCMDFVVTADEGSYAHDWAAQKGLVEPLIHTPGEFFTYD